MKKSVLFILSSIVCLSIFAQIDLPFFKTKLQVQVIDANGNAVGGAKVTLYSTNDDYIKEINPVYEAEYSDKRGIVLYKDVKPLPYYIAVKKEKLSNSGKNPLIDTLKKSKLNKINIVVE